MEIEELLYFEIKIDNLHFEANLSVFLWDENDHERAVLDRLRDQMATHNIDVRKIILLFR